MSSVSPHLVAIVLETTDHRMPCPSWAAFLLACWPAEYREADSPLYPTSCLPGSPGKVEVMASRLARGLSPWHPLDGQPEQCDGLGQPADPGRNGRVLGRRDLLTLRHHQAVFAAAQQRRKEEIAAARKAVAS